MARQIVIYTQPGCAACERARQFLDDQGVTYLERSLAAHPQVAQELQDLGALVLPVFLVDGRPILGDDRPRLIAALQERELPLTDAVLEAVEPAHIPHGGV